VELGSAQPLRLDTGAAESVSGLWLRPAAARACLVLAHGAGAGMVHPSLEILARDLAEQSIATLRYQFPFMEHGGKRPDPPAVAHATVRAAVAAASQLSSDLPLFAGGRSFGGRMTSQAHAASPLPGVKGVVFFAFPLHPAGRPSTHRGRHLFEVHIPMLFLQGTRDTLADLSLIQQLCKELGDRATLKTLDEADHSFHVLVRSGRTVVEVRREAVGAVSAWINQVTSWANTAGDPAVRNGLTLESRVPSTP
jgi:predicted alpha/beta-hydrolase family hydrolase